MAHYHDQLIGAVRKLLEEPPPGPGRVVTLRGWPGVGKTELAGEVK